MATVVFWLSVLLGVPMIAAAIAQLIISAALEFAIGERWKQIPDWVWAFPGGMIAMGIAGLLAGWLLGAMTATVPFAAAAVAVIWHVARREMSNVAPYVAGILLTYVLWFR